MREIRITVGDPTDVDYINTLVTPILRAYGALGAWKKDQVFSVLFPGNDRDDKGIEMVTFLLKSYTQTTFKVLLVQPGVVRDVKV